MKLKLGEGLHYYYDTIKERFVCKLCGEETTDELSMISHYDVMAEEIDDNSNEPRTPNRNITRW